MYLLTQVDAFQYPGGDELFVLDIIPLHMGLAAVASDQSLCIFDPLRLNQGPLKRIQTNHGNLTSAKGYDPAASIVCTTGEAGSVSMWDLRLASAQAEVLRLGG
jgi:WD repeat-containing protein 89